MPIPISIEQAAEILHVHENSVRRHIVNDGLPTVSGPGGKGPSNGAKVDAARLARWHDKHLTKEDRPHWLQPSSNPLREISEFQLEQTLRAAGRALAALTKNGPFTAPLLTREQAKKTYGVIALIVNRYTRGGEFEKNLAAMLGLGDLDDAASFLTAGDFHTKWQRGHALPIPPEIGELFTDDELREFARRK